MQGLISLVGFAIWLGVWVLIVRRRKKMGLLVANIAGVIVGFVAFAIFIAVVAPEPTPEEKLARAEAQRESDAQAAAEKARKELEGAAAEKTKDRSVMAAIICSNFVEASLKSPKSADFPWDKAAGGTRNLGNQTYAIRSYVDAQNSYGAELRNWYDCKVQYKAGEDVNPANWKLLALQFSQ